MSGLASKFGGKTPLDMCGVWGSLALHLGVRRRTPSRSGAHFYFLGQSIKGFVNALRRALRRNGRHELTEKVKKCSSSWANQEKCAVGVRMYATYRAPLGASL